MLRDVVAAVPLSEFEQQALKMLLLLLQNWREQLQGRDDVR